MKIKNVNLEYYIMIKDFNSDKIKRINIFSRTDTEKIAKLIRTKRIKNKSELKEWLKRDFMCHFWSKSEYEVSVGGLLSKYPEKFTKIDGWYQIELNLDMITDYTVNKMQINFE